ncbi:regulator of chromosome condensation 1/beta-lactamase-inhibitor protein II [Radiomyces spectabilis]|uniref:regulator of chromosome condensation 1/beta-lactamase-inhibitor protein II n=1 Tax=Radiomyces spectabilis TaxID=64574 RepID=UPI002220B0ED|nr:regulator of chromosome condensation 1/beta-lactamase-inhibitor protein II [Radiomyces spectabilis]KAI8370342.1 regulator of chromosome condensation 1/beta-lactamase-inhibitor protein II [Radiomyces spectabilis]
MQVYAFGSNGNGQLGIGHTDDTFILTPCLGLPENQSIIKIASGGNHAAALTCQGEIYLTGASQRGDIPRLSNTQSDSESWHQFQRPAWLRQHRWRDVACGWAFTIAVSEEGRVYGFGSAKCGELPMSSDIPIEIDAQLSNIVAVACGWRHVVALDGHGQVYSWGWGRHGQLGPDRGMVYPKSIRPVQAWNFSEPIAKVACGHMHTVLKSREGTVYAFGSDKYGQSSVPLAIHATDISAGWHHTAALDRADRLIMWGRNDHGQLQALDNVQLFVCGSEHALALTQGQVLAWGWNEHGNCGVEEDPTVKTPIPLAGLPSNRVVLLAAGCATSWIGLTV